jgi:fatty acyl-CoA reductase
MNPEDYEKLTNEVDIVINNAASVDFNSRVDIALKINAKGPINVLNFCKDCPQLEIFCHVSTAYVGCNQP